MFYLVRLDRDGDGNLVETPLPDFGTFEKGADAAKSSKVAAHLTGAKVQCRRIAQAGDWRGAMAKRVFGGDLTPLPKDWNLEPIKDHFAHLDAKDPSKIAFIENEEHGIINRVTAVTPGRYLTRFYPEVDDNTRRHLIAAIDPSGEIFFATTPGDISYVYENGPESCMDGEHDFSDLPVWPTAPYGAGDLAVAYTKNKKGNIQSRCLCWPEKKVFGRCYGDVQRMIKAMKAEGYTYLRDENNNKRDVFVGARIMKIATGHEDNQYVMPYFDDINVAIDVGDHFITAQQGAIGQKWCGSGGSSSGSAFMAAMCPKLNQTTYAGDLVYVHGADQEWSRPAVRDYAFTCEGSGKIWSHDYKVVMGTGLLWSREHFDEHGEFCEVTRQNWPKVDMVQLGSKRMHRSVASRFDDKGNELPSTLKPTTRTWGKSDWLSPVDPSLLRKEMENFSNSYDALVLNDAVSVFTDRVIATDLVLNRRRRVA